MLETTTPDWIEQYQPLETQKELLLSLFKFYEEHKALPYVWCGKSPKTLKQSPQDEFIDQQRLILQPPGAITSGLPIVPGFDCSGFMRYFLASNGFEAFKQNKTTRDFLAENEVKSVFKLNSTDLYENIDQAEIFDLIFFGRYKGEGKHWNHVGIYLGNGEIIHASRVKKTIDCTDAEIQKWNNLNLDYNDIKYRGGINISHILNYETPEWEAPNTHCAIVKISQ